MNRTITIDLNGARVALHVDETATLLDVLRSTGVESVTWGDYPILRFDEVPPIDVELVAMPNATPWGAGEISQGATMAAIGNALAQALGARVCAMPFTRQRIATALLQDSVMESDDSAAR